MRTILSLRRKSFQCIVLVTLSAIVVLTFLKKSSRLKQVTTLKNNSEDSYPLTLLSSNDHKTSVYVPKRIIKASEAVLATKEGFSKWNEFVRDRGLTMDKKYPIFRANLPFHKNAYDIMSMNPIKFDPVYKNPCWLGSETNGPIADGKLHCLPYFYLIGVKKSATSDLYSRIRAHPDFTFPGFKESQWMPRLRWGIFAGPDRRFNTGGYMSCKDVRSVECFISMFDNAAKTIFNDRLAHKNSSLITADSTPNTLYSHTNWKLLPGNEGLLEPKYTDFHYIKHLTPNVKIVIIMRDPVTRLYSDFLHTMGIWASGQSRSTPETFHEHVTQLTHAYDDCFSHWSMRRCIYNETIRHRLMQKRIFVADSFTAGFYAFYMKEMINVFGKDRIHPILTKEYHENMESTLSDLFAFLDMNKLNPPEIKQISSQPERHVRKTYSEMLNKTRDLLYRFYKPYNRNMAILMNDDRYLFPKQP